MAQPTASDVFVNIPLTTLSVAYMQQATDFVATQVFPVVPSDLQGHSYFVYERDDFYRIAAAPRAPGSESAGSGVSLTTDTFFCKPYAVHKDIDDQTLATQVNPLNIEMTSTRWVTLQLMLKREALFMTNFFGTGIWTGASGGTDITGVASSPGANQVLKWSVAGSTPVEDVDTQIWNIKQKTGYKPNVAVITPDVYQDLKNHAEFLDRVKYTQTGVLTTDLLAQVWGLDKVLVASATSVTSDETFPDSISASNAATYAFVAGTGGMLLAYSAPEPGLDVPSAGYTFAWTGYTGAGAEGNRIKSFRIEPRESTRIEGTLAIDPHVVAADMGCFFTSLH